MGFGPESRWDSRMRWSLVTSSPTGQHEGEDGGWGRAGFESRLLTPALSSLGEEREKKREFRVGYEIRPLYHFGHCSKAISKCNW